MRSTQLRVLGLAWGILFASTTFAQNTQTATVSGNEQAARDHFTTAQSHYKEGKFVEALFEFKKAYDLVPRPSITYNIARCYEQLAQYPEAIASYERFVTETTDVRAKSEALDRIDFLRGKTSADSSSPDTQYRARIDAGKKAYSRGDYETSIQEFKAAFDIKPSSGALFNIAKSYERMGRYEEAIEFYTQYLDLDPNAMDRPDVEETIRRLKKSIRERYQELSVSSDPPGADVYLDDRNTGLQGQTNARFQVKPGPHTLYVDLNGYQPVERTFVMPDDKPLALEFSMKKLKNVGYAEIKVNVDGARIFIDGAIIGLTPYTQKKALNAGPHQVTIEAMGYPRWNGDFTVTRDQTTPINIQLERYAAPVSDGTLSSWGRNLIVLGLIGGTLGVIGPFAYQKLIVRRDIYEYVGPDEVRWGPNTPANQAQFWRGSPKDGSGAIRGDISGDDENASFRGNGKSSTLKAIQLWSIVGGSVVAATGLGFYIYKWARPTKEVSVVVAERDAAPSPFTLTGFGVAPNADGRGAALGLSGSF